MNNYKELEKRIRCKKKYRNWVKKVIDLNPKCDCGIFGDCLEVHHKIKLIDIIIKNKLKNMTEAMKCEEIWNLLNGEVYCSSCHREKHLKENLSQE